jgi:UDP-glucose 4-epimerase
VTSEHRRARQRVRRLAGSRSEIVFVPYHQAWDDQFEDMQRRVPNLSRVQNLLGFTARTGLDQIIASVVEHERRAPPRER